MIYLDHNATTPVDPQVEVAMEPFWKQTFGNPSSSHGLGRAAKRALESARERVAGLLNCLAEEVVFTSGGTESNNMVIKGVAHNLSDKGKHIITSAIEHPATTNPCRFLMSQGFDVTFLPVDTRGLVDPSAVEEAIKPSTILVSVMHANNETGTVEPVPQIGKVAQEAGILFHTDAAQSAGKIPVDVSELNVDFLSLAGHKMYGPKGVGALFVKGGIRLEPLLHGAGQESGRRAGTENVASAVGLGKACVLAKERMPDEAGHIKDLRDLFHRLLGEYIPGLVLNGHPHKRLPNTLHVSVPGVDGNILLDSTPEICASTGAACHECSVSLSHVLTAMKVPQEIGRGAVRLTLGRKNTEEEIRTAAKMLAEAFNKAQRLW